MKSPKKSNSKLRSSGVLFTPAKQALQSVLERCADDCTHQKTGNGRRVMMHRRGRGEGAHNSVQQHAHVHIHTEHTTSTPQKRAKNQKGKNRSEMMMKNLRNFGTKRFVSSTSRPFFAGFACPVARKERGTEASRSGSIPMNSIEFRTSRCCLVKSHMHLHASSVLR